MKKKKVRSHCPINFMVETLGDRWSFLILRDLVMRGKRYYGEMLESEEGISTNILAARLVQLEREGFVVKRRDQTHGSRYVYTPTQKALDAISVMLQMVLWSYKYDPDSLAPRELVERIKADPEKIRREFEELLKKVR